MYTTWSHDSHVTSSRALCGPPVHPEVLSDQYWDMRLSGLTTCLCLLFLLSALLTRVVCAHALLVFTSVLPSKVVYAACEATFQIVLFVCGSYLCILPLPLLSFLLSLPLPFSPFHRGTDKQ